MLRARSANILEPSHVRRRLYEPKSALTKTSHQRQFLASILLLIGAVITTTLIGMRFMFDFRNGRFPLTSPVAFLPYFWGWRSLPLFASGLPFSMTIFGILFAHELGHLGASKLFGLDMSLSDVFFSPFRNGIFGSFDHIRSCVPSRAALIATGASGPIAGFAAAFATTCYGLVHSTTTGLNSPPPLISVSAPGVFNVLRSTILASYPAIPPLPQMVPHPVLLASWIGLLVTALNLIPAGRLDGGQVAYAISPRLHKITSNLAIAALLYFGAVEWIGWLFWAWLLMMPSMRYPQVRDQTPLGVEWLVLPPVCFAIFLLTASTQPLTGMSLVQLLLRSRWGL